MSDGDSSNVCDLSSFSDIYTKPFLFTKDVFKQMKFPHHWLGMSRGGFIPFFIGDGGGGG